jgi:hypothetical protein
MRTRPKRPFVGLSTRLDLESDERLRRVCDACQLSLPRVLEAVIRHGESSLLHELTEAERRAFRAGNYEACREAIARQITVT